MKKMRLKKFIGGSLVAAISSSAAMGLSSLTFADELTDALTGGKAYGDIRLRHESVEQDNGLDDATALTIRTRLGYKTGAYKGFSAVIEVEDSRIVAGQDEFAVPPTGFNTGVYSVVADPEGTEIDQGYIQYKNDTVTAKVGTQVLTLDGHRFVGHVGWRQDRQTFDAASFVLTPADGLTVSYAHLYGRNRIFAEVADQDSKDHLLNIKYQLKPLTITAYAYLLEDDFGVNATRDTYGISVSGSSKLDDIKLLYTAEFASQTYETDTGADFDTDYLFLEAGVVFSGVTAKLGYEVLGSDDGAFGFGTPLATLHKFNGWADVFLGTPGTGLVDTYISFSAKVGPGKLTAVYHDFTADEDSPTLDDLGSEIDIAYGMKFGKNYNAGIKYADYSADDFAVDTEKFWLWVGLSF